LLTTFRRIEMLRTGCAVDTALVTRALPDRA